MKGIHPSIALIGWLCCLPSCGWELEKNEIPPVEVLLEAQTCMELAKCIQALGPTDEEILFPILEDFARRSGLRAAFHFETGCLAFVGPRNPGDAISALLVEVVNPRAPFTGNAGDIPEGVEVEWNISMTTIGSAETNFEGVFMVGSNADAANFVYRQVNQETGDVQFRRYCEEFENGMHKASIFHDVAPAHRELWEQLGIWPGVWE